MIANQKMIDRLNAKAKNYYSIGRYGLSLEASKAADLVADFMAQEAKSTLCQCANPDIVELVNGQSFCAFCGGDLYDLELARAAMYDAVQDQADARLCKSFSESL
jgi:hypothetical protein